MKKYILLLVAMFPSLNALAQFGVSADTITLGQSAAFSGPAKDLGVEMRDGALLAFNEFNRQGGAHGRKIKLISYDDGYEPDRAVANTKKLINDDKVFALFGAVGTPTSKAVLPIFTEAKVPYFGAFSGAELLRSPFNRYIFNVRASYYDETERIVEHLISLGRDKIGVLYQNDAYGQAGLAGVERALRKRKLEIAVKATIERNSSEVSAAVKQMNAAGPQAVVMIGAYDGIAAFVKAMKQSGSNTEFHNVSFVGSISLAKALGADGAGVAISQVVPSPFDQTVPIVKEYQRLMKAAGGAGYSFTSLEGYIAARVFIEGLKRAGKNLSREGFIDALEGMWNVNLDGFHIAFSPQNHQASTFVDMTMIARDGRFVR
ncbi:MAG: ABC transporter substrate-binding protein [Rhodocyclaceae bacterium]|nr:ABC transporter substrate-binding protein [Rhodocyclaceae bacterium]